MKIFVPKSYRIKHKILKFLSKERMKNGGLNPTKEYTFSLREISTEINEKFDDVYSISDYLFYKKLAYFKKNENEITNPFCWVSDQGIETYSSFKYINDGKQLQTTLFNNLSTGFFQIIVGVIAVFTIVYNYNDSKLYYEQVKHLEHEVKILSTEISEYKLKNNNSVYITKNCEKKSHENDSLKKR